MQCKELPSWVGSISRFVVVALGQQYWGRISVSWPSDPWWGHRSKGNRLHILAEIEVYVDLEKEDKCYVLICVPIKNLTVYRGFSPYANFLTAIFQNFPLMFAICHYWLFHLVTAI